MGFFLSCCRSTDPAYETPGEDERRQKMSEAAERRLREQESRGLKDGSAGVRRIAQAKERSQQVEDALDTPNSEGTLRWQVT